MNYLSKEGETPKEFAERLQTELDEYKSKVSGLRTKDELDAEEKNCMDELDKYEAYIKETVYEMPDSVDYDGTHYTRKEIAVAILYFLNKMEVKWDFTLGMYELSKMWRNDVAQLNFHEMDSTLRTLDQVQFKGWKEWKDILAINEYFKANNDQFSVDTAGFIFLHQKHNAVLEQMELIKTVGDGHKELEEDKSVDEPVTMQEVRKKSKK